MGFSSNPSVSVVIPALNEGDWVRRTVEAVQQQSDGWPLEIVVVDDGSTDGCCDFLAEYQPDGHMVKPVKGEGAGNARAKNRGASAATGDILVFLDAHVIPDAGWLSELVKALQDSTVGVAGLGVRAIDNPASVGYAYTFIDENISAGWVPPQGESPHEVPCVIGCCMAMRRDAFQDMGGFDPNHVRWGVEDIEMSLRAWYLGYRCVASSKVQVAHYFKRGKPRNFAVSWEENDVNLLHCVFTYFSESTRNAVLAGIGQRENFNRSLARVMGDAAFWRWREGTQRRFCRDEDWYFTRFSTEMTRFRERIKEIRNAEGKTMVTPLIPVICSRCGASNIGVQTQCLLCQAPLQPPPMTVVQSQPTPPTMVVQPPPPPPTIVTQPPPPPPTTVVQPPQSPPTIVAQPPPPPPTIVTQPPPTTTVVQPQPPPPTMVVQPPPPPPVQTAVLVCGRCGAQSPPGRRFCAQCGGPLAEPAPQPTPAPAQPAANICPRCGAGAVPGRRFCAQCGAPVAQPAPAPAQAAFNICPGCGATVAPGQRFCNRCGSPMGGVAAQPAPAPIACPRCGGATKPGARFCTRCGHRFEG